MFVSRNLTMAVGLVVTLSACASRHAQPSAEAERGDGEGRLGEDATRTAAHAAESLVSVVGDMPERDAPVGLPRGDEGYTVFRAGDLGSGVLVGDYVVTTQDVVKHAYALRVRFSDGSEIPAKVAKLEEACGIVALELEAPVEHDALNLGKASTLKSGDPILALGTHFEHTPSVSAGVVAAAPYGQFVITDAAIHAGNNGGALITPDGDLVGINTAAMSMYDGFEGLGLAVGTRCIRSLLDMESQGLERRVSHERALSPLAGVYLKDLDDEARGRLGIDERIEGARVVAVDEDGRFAKVGIVVDDVVVEVDLQPIRSAEEARIVASQRHDAEPVVLVVLRNQSVILVTVP